MKRKNIFYSATKDRHGNIYVEYIDGVSGRYKDIGFVWYTVREVIASCRKDYNINMTRDACKAMYKMGQNKQVQVCY
jgi:GH35 family endo-1,4-beta-xylanase